MAYKDMFTILVVDSRIERSQSLRDAFGRVLGYLREDHHLRTDVLGTTQDAVIRLRSDASVACLLLEWGGTKGGIDGKRVLDTVADIGLQIPVFLVAPADDLAREQQGLLADVVCGLIYPLEDAPDFVARYVNRHFEANFSRNVLKPAYAAAGWRDGNGNGRWTWHSLRHVFCTTALFTWKLDATDVSCMAGHANVRTTLLMYVGTTAGVLDRARKATQ